MFKGPFTVDISDTAQIIDVSVLPDRERRLMMHGLKYDPRKHETYKILVAPLAVVVHGPLSRVEKRRSFEKVTRVIVDIARGHPGIEIFGMYPTTLRADGNWALDLNSPSFLDPVIQRAGAMKLSAEGKKVARQEKRRPHLLAHRTEKRAQWLFFKEWLETEADFRFQIVCVVSKGIPAHDRYLTCNARFEDSGRIILKIENHRVGLPLRDQITDDDTPPQPEPKRRLRLPPQDGAGTSAT